MGDTALIEALGDHTFVVHLLDLEGEAVEVRVYASPAVLVRLGAVNALDEHDVVEATTAYLLARQRADELPPFLELDDVAAAYDEYVADIEHRLRRGEAHSDQ